MFDILTGIVGSIFSGGATGLIGIVAQRYFDYKNKQQEIQIVQMNLQNAIDIKRIDLEVAKEDRAARVAVADKEMLARIEEAEQTRAAREFEAEASVQKASYETDSAAYLTADVLKAGRFIRWTMAAVDALRGSIRPVLTVYLVIVTHLMYNEMHRLLVARGASLSNSDVMDIVTQIVGTLLYLATTAVVWWFGTRPPKRQGDK